MAVVHHLKPRANAVYYIGQDTPHERQLIEQGGFDGYFRIQAGKLRRYQGLRWWQQLLKIRTLLLNIIDVFRFGIGCLQSLWRLWRLRPDRVFIKGGYVGLPVGFAAWLLRIPCIIHESDCVPGLTNRLLSRFTSYRVSGFAIEGFWDLGNPIRQSLLEPTSLDRRHFGIESQCPIILVMGGSLGSKSINTAAQALAARTEAYELIHIYGRATPPLDMDYPHYHPYEFLHEEMAAALQLADIVVSRAGANTLAELAALAKPTIVVPHPNLSGDHQTRNAQHWSDALVLVPQAELSAQRLQQEIDTLLGDAAERSRLQQRLHSYARPTAAADIAEYILNPEPV